MILTIFLTYLWNISITTLCIEDDAEQQSGDPSSLSLETLIWSFRVVKIIVWRLKDGSVIKGTGCYSRRPELNTQYPPGRSQFSVPPVLADLIP